MHPRPFRVHQQNPPEQTQAAAPANQSNALGRQEKVPPKKNAPAPPSTKQKQEPQARAFARRILTSPPGALAAPAAGLVLLDAQPGDAALDAAREYLAGAHTEGTQSKRRQYGAHQLAEEPSLRVLEDLHALQRVKVDVDRDLTLQFV